MRAAVVVALLWGAPLWAQDCADPQTQADMTGCAALDFAQADAALNAEYAATRDRAKARGAAQADALLQAQRAWIAYRDAACKAQGLEFEGGSLEPMVVAMCKTELTQRRSEDLRRLYENQ
ncbi:lysozyme inhibitor LprI family protein [Thioclava litoralis]|uniref:Lysozyme inhibitor LprI family protein n=1 Tax=Thioclava litoralis TaxID=3076557 RepID=A0ABZ1DX67_9RHOB|nr:lysozyme inhibitor LprI family protein [Thioclava sp. FTW29]